MNTIDTNKLITFLSYILIIVLLTSILYNMYNNYLNESFNIKKFNLKEKFTDSDIIEKLKYINLIKKLNNNVNSEVEDIPQNQNI